MQPRKNLRKQEPSTTGRLVASTATALRCASIAALFLLFVAMALPAFAQVNTSVQGRVYDTTGAAIPQATVTALNNATGVSRSTQATATGDYSITLLPPGEYTVTAEQPGFKKSAKKVRLEIGAAANVDFDLAVGQVTQEVQVQDIGEVAEPTRTMVSSVIDQQKIEDLPVNGRQFIVIAATGGNKLGTPYGDAYVAFALPQD